jgi:F0F1-type ATP synthase assembly protein I
MAAKLTKQQQNTQWLEASSLAWMFPIALALGFGAGYGLDKLFGTRPWLTIIFSCFGLAAAFINLFRIGLAGTYDYVPPADVPAESVRPDSGRDD